MFTWKFYLLIAFTTVAVGSFFYKKAQLGGIKPGSFLVIQGLFFLTTMLTSIFLLNIEIVFDPFLFLGIAAGVFGATGAFSILISLKKGEVGANIAIARLSFIPAVIGAIIFFGETLTFRKILLFFFAGLAVYLFVDHYRKENSHAIKSIIPAIIGSLAFGGFDLVYKYASIKGVNPYLLLTVQSITGNIIFNIYVFFFEKYKFTRSTIKFAPICGVLFATGCLAWLKSLTGVDVSLVAPFMQMNFILTYFLSVVFLKESMTMRKLTGIFIVLTSILLMSDVIINFMKTYF